MGTPTLSTVVTMPFSKGKKKVVAIVAIVVLQILLKLEIITSAYANNERTKVRRVATIKSRRSCGKILNRFQLIMHRMDPFRFLPLSIKFQTNNSQQKKRSSDDNNNNNNNNNHSQQDIKNNFLEFIILDLEKNNKQNNTFPENNK